MMLAFKKSKLPSRKKQAKKSRATNNVRRTATIKKTKRRAIAKKTARLKVPKLVKAGKSPTQSLKKNLALLRKLGLWKSKRDLRKVKASDKRLKKVIVKYKDVLRGKAKVAKFKKKSADAYKRAGYRTVGRNVIIPKEKGVRVRKRGEFIERRRKFRFGEFILLAIPASYVDMQQHLETFETDPEIQKLLSQGWKLALRYYGNWSYATMEDFDALRSYLERYDLDAEGKEIQNLEMMIVLLAPGSHLPGEAERKKKRHRKPARSYKFGRPLRLRSPAAWARKKAYMKSYMRKKRKKK